MTKTMTKTKTVVVSSCGHFDARQKSEGKYKTWLDIHHVYTGEKLCDWDTESGTIYVENGPFYAGPGFAPFLQYLSKIYKLD